MLLKREGLESLLIRVKEDYFLYLFYFFKCMAFTMRVHFYYLPFYRRETGHLGEPETA